ncbi:MAG: cupredoxin domain-containing protein [Acidimicrobiia bacterium]|nr:cupredoxin domain-containing protein [Acidimicrobiia bacterium]
MSDSAATTRETERDQSQTEQQGSSSSTDVERSTMTGETFFAALKDGALVLFALFFGVVALGIKSSGLDGTEAAGPVASSGIIDVILYEFVIEGNLVAPPGEVVLEIVNVGSVDHNVVGRTLERRTPDIQPIGSTTLSLGVLEPGDYELFCDISGHEESGMVATLTVTEPVELDDPEASG